MRGGGGGQILPVPITQSFSKDMDLKFMLKIRISRKARRMLTCPCSQPTFIKLKCEFKKALSHI